ncbi:hypothetical protein NT6N_24900 [Oceaniferula spumae]|uniref:Ferredoxin n=1 Tax=Oceaniferula spumae TaxID=2979115 RepID=A0AAT9FN60_9BACT
MRASHPIVAKNVEGRYYVDESCVYCEACLRYAPANFGYDEDQNVAFIMKQPSSHEEHERTAIAIRSCPNLSIGDKLRRHEGAIDDLGIGYGSTPKGMFGALGKIVASWLRESK